MTIDPEKIMNAIMNKMQGLEIPFEVVPNGDGKTKRTFGKAVKEFKQEV
jgi:hypothetical protein